MTIGSPSSVTLPAGFMWGASTAAHPIEGNNIASDWWHKEHAPGSFVTEPSGDAADSYHRWGEDMDLLVELGFTDYRFSIEWARIEPAEGYFSRGAIAHYRRMVQGANARGLRPLLTLHHFTLPQWLASRGGWLAEDAIDRFISYIQHAAPIIRAGVHHVVTINEPNMVALFPALFSIGADVLAMGGTPEPDKATTKVLIEAHHRASAAVKAIDPEIQVGWSVANLVFEALPGAEQIAREYAWPREDIFVDAAKTDDWIGVQAYCRMRVGIDGAIPPDDSAERTLAGLEYYPAAIGCAVRHVAATIPGVPIIVTENGIATSDDARRIDYTAAALQGLAAAMLDGIDIRGYFHWSALDNYEWGSFKPTFGLIAWDHDTFARTPKSSARWLGQLARSGQLPLPR